MQTKTCSARHKKALKCVDDLSQKDQLARFFAIPDLKIKASVTSFIQSDKPTVVFSGSDQELIRLSHSLSNYLIQKLGGSEVSLS